MKADIYGLDKPKWSKDKQALAKEVGKVKVPEFQPKSGVKIETDPNVRRSNARIFEPCGLDG